MIEQVVGEQLLKPLSGLFSAPDYNRPVTILKQQCRQLLNEDLRGFCAGEVFAQSRIWLALFGHTEAAWEELRAGQDRCALEMGLFLFELTRLLAEHCTAEQPSFPLLLSRQQALLESVSDLRGPDRAEVLFRLQAARQALQELLDQKPVPEAENTAERLFRGDDRLLTLVSSTVQGPVLTWQGETVPLTFDLAPTPWAYARVLLLARQQDSLYDLLLDRPELLPEWEDYFPLFSAVQALELHTQTLRELTVRAGTLADYAHIFNVLVNWLHGEQSARAAALLPELMGLTRRAELKKMLGSLRTYEQDRERRRAQPETL